MAPAVPGSGAAGERRHYPRKNIIESQLLTIDMVLDEPERQRQPQRGIVIDVSEGGLAVQPFLPLAPGRTGKLHLELPGAKPFAGTGLVAWVGAGGRAGIRFLDVPAEARQQLQEWLGVAPAAVSAAPAAAPADADSEILDFQAALQLFAERARTISNAAGAAVALGDSSGMVCEACVGMAPDVGVRLRPDSGLSGYCLSSGEIVHCADTHSDPRVDTAAARQLDLRSVLILPVFVAGRLAGMLEVLSPRPGGFEAHQVTRLGRLAKLLGAAIEEHQRARILAPIPVVELQPVEEPGAPPTAEPLAATSAIAETDEVEQLGATAAPLPAEEPATPLFTLDAATPAAEDEHPQSAVDAEPAPIIDSEPKTELLSLASPSSAAPLPEPDLQVCDACGYSNPAGARDCENCDVPLPVALAAEREDDVLESATAPRPSAPSRTPPVRSIAHPSLSLSSYAEPPSAAHGPLGSTTQLGIILLVLLGALGAAATGWYVGRARVPAQPASGAASVTPRPSAQVPEPAVSAQPATVPAAATPGGRPAVLEAAAAPLGSAEVPGVLAEKVSGAPGAGRESAKSPKISAAGGGTRDQAEITTVLTSLSVVMPQEKVQTGRRAQLIPGKLVRKVEPVYPASARAGQIAGAVVLTATVTRKGAVENVKVVSGPEVLAAAAASAIRQWRYQPYQLDGQPVDVETTIAVNFSPRR